MAFASRSARYPQPSRMMRTTGLGLGMCFYFQTGSLSTGDCGFTKEFCTFAQFFFYAQQLVVFGDPVRAACRAGLDLSGLEADREVGDEGVFGFAGTMRNDRGISVPPGQVDSVNRFRNSPDLVQLNEDGIGHALVNTLPQTLRVRNKNIVTDKLDLVIKLLRQPFPAIPIILGKTILDRNDRVLPHPVGIKRDHFISGLSRLIRL